MYQLVLKVILGIKGVLFHQAKMGWHSEITDNL